MMTDDIWNLSPGYKMKTWTVGELSEIYQEAVNRNVVVTKGGEVGLGFDMPDGSTIRIALNAQRAVWLCTTLNEALLGLLLEVVPKASLPFTRPARTSEP